MHQSAGVTHSWRDLLQRDTLHVWLQSCHIWLAEMQEQRATVWLQRPKRWGWFSFRHPHHSRTAGGLTENELGNFGCSVGFGVSTASHLCVKSTSCAHRGVHVTAVPMKSPVADAHIPRLADHNDCDWPASLLDICLGSFGTRRYEWENMNIFSFIKALQTYETRGDSASCSLLLQPVGLH